jgi:alpha-galactosidase
MSFNLTESPWIRAGRQYTIHNLWTKTKDEIAVRNITKTLPPHGVMAMVLSDAGPEPKGLDPPCSIWEQCTDKNGTRLDRPPIFEEL